MLRKIELMRTNVYKSDNQLFINDKRRGTSDVVSINAQPMIDTVPFNHFPIFINQ